MRGFTGSPCWHQVSKVGALWGAARGEGPPPELTHCQRHAMLRVGCGEGGVVEWALPLFYSASPPGWLPLGIRPQLGHGFFQKVFLVLFHTGWGAPPALG